jgi:hypothetical protein
MADQGFIAYTPLVNVKGTSFKAQLGQIDGRWHIKITRGLTEISTNPLTGLDPDEITNFIQSAITLPGFSGLYANYAAGALLKEAEKGEVFVPEEPKPDLPPAEPKQRESEYRPTLLSQMGISKSEPPVSKSPETEEETGEPTTEDESSEDQDSKTKEEKEKLSENPSDTNPSSARSNMNEFASLLKSSSKPMSNDKVEKNCEVSFPFAFSLNVASGFVSKEFGVSSVEKFRQYLNNQLVETLDIQPDNPVSDTVSQFRQWMNQFGFNSTILDKETDKATLSIATFEPKEKIQENQKMNILPQGGFSVSMCKSLIDKIASMADLKTEYLENSDGLRVIFTR